MKFQSEFETGWDDTTEDWLVATTGEWRFRRPSIDISKCCQCGWCYLYCPVNCIGADEDEVFYVDLTYCKGCGICAKECPASAIQMIEEIK